MGQWLRTDETLEAVTSLEMVCDLLPKVIDNNHYWKWVVISLHNALQGYMVLALRGSDSMNVLTDKCAKEWGAYFQKKGAQPKRRMDDFSNLYKKIQNSKLMMMYVDSQPFKPKGSQTESVERLKKLRNEFIHFLPKLMRRDVTGLPSLTKDCIDIIAFLAFECGNISWYETDLESKTRDLIEKVRPQLTALHQFYGV